MKKTYLLLALVILLFCAFLTINSKLTKQQTSNIQMNAPNPEELGKVKWLRDYDEAIKLAKKQDRPILILFQEVPGCSTCKNFGKEALSDPLIVDAIENEFIPLAIHNNKKGKDALVLKSFNEPAWNNPVVRIFNHQREELSDRLSKYNSTELVKGMATALKKHQTEVPEYLSLLKQSVQAEKTHKEIATYAMHCYWKGEAKLGNIEGVLSSKAGIMDNHEVVTVEYNPEILNYESLTHQAQKLQCDSKVYYRNDSQKEIATELIGEDKIKEAGKFNLAKDPKYYLSRSYYKYVPMLPIQASKVNAALGNNLNPKTLLSPKQISMYDFIKNHDELNWDNQILMADLTTNWEKVEAQIINAKSAYANKMRNGRR